MTEQSRQMLFVLSGDHVLGRLDRRRNWFKIWLPGFASFLFVGAVEASARGRDHIEITVLSALATGLGTLAGGLWIRASNSVRHRFSPGFVERIAPWPLPSWKVWSEELEEVHASSRRGQWFLQLDLRSEGQKVVLTTESIRTALRLPC